MENKDIFIGYVKSFKMARGKNRKKFSGHPIVGRLYRIIKDEDGCYLLHVGYETTQTDYAGLILGPELTGSHAGQWSYEIEPVTKDNIMDFDLDVEDIRKFADWEKNGHNDLIEELSEKVEVDEDDNVISEDNNKVEITGADGITPLGTYLEAQAHFTKVMDELGNSLNTIVKKDKYFALAMGETLNYIATTYGDKYEIPGRLNLNKEYILSATTPEHCIASAMKYMLRYDTKGFEKSRNPRDIQKAIHYLLFELQRSIIQNQTNEQKNFGK